MPRKPPPNAFYFYMKAVQEDMKLRGQRVPSMKEMPALTSPAWNRMTSEERAEYEEMAKEFKRNRSNTDDGRFTSDGIPIQVLKQQEAELEEKIRKVDTAVRTLVKTFHSVDEIAQSSFFIMGFNILIGTLEDLYLPNEIGIVEYSICDGIKNEYHKFIDPGQIPIGYTSTAKSNSENVHEIPISGFVLATSDYTKLYKEIKRFLGLQKHPEPRYIFCHPNEVKQFQLCLDWLKDNSRSDGREEIVVAGLDVLIAELKTAVNEPYPYKSSAQDAITSNAFDYSPNTLCAFHDEKDNKNCALGYCKRLGYVLSDILCNSFGVSPTSKHFPERLAPTESTVWVPKQDIRPVFNKVDVPIKPLIPHNPTTIVQNIRSKFDDDDNYSITRSAMSETSSVVSESVQLDDSMFPSLSPQFDDSMFPSLSDQMSSISISSSKQPSASPSGNSWAQVSSKSQPMRMPRSLPESLRTNEPVANVAPAPGFGRGVGIGRGRGLMRN